MKVTAGIYVTQGEGLLFRYSEGIHFQKKVLIIMEWTDVQPQVYCY